jgi:Calcium-dependent channel, 7TM region, putative phosphate
MTPSTTAIRTRDAFVLAVMALLLLFWILPISALASLLSYKEIKKVMPKLGELIDANERVRAIVQNSLPSVAMIMLNALLPFILEGTPRVCGRISLLTPAHSFDIRPGLSSQELGGIFAFEEVCPFSCFFLCGR